MKFKIKSPSGKIVIVDVERITCKKCGRKIEFNLLLSKDCNYLCCLCNLKNSQYCP